MIAAANGYTVGGGLELALNADFVCAATTAVFGLPEVTRGIMPGGGATTLLPRRIGSARARELIFTGALVSADETIEVPGVDVLFEELITFLSGACRHRTSSFAQSAVLCPRSLVPERR